MRRVIYLLTALSLFADTKQETIKPSQALSDRLARLEAEQKDINAQQREIIARQKAVQAEAEEIRVRVCWEAGVMPDECGPWNGREVMKIAKPEKQ